MMVYLLLEGVDLGDRVRGVFSSQALAQEAAYDLASKQVERLGRESAVTLKNLQIEPFQLDELDYP